MADFVNVTPPHSGLIPQESAVTEDRDIHTRHEWNRFCSPMRALRRLRSSWIVEEVQRQQDFMDVEGSPYVACQIHESEHHSSLTNRSLSRWECDFVSRWRMSQWVFIPYGFRAEEDLARWMGLRWLLWRTGSRRQSRWCEISDVFQKKHEL